MDFELNLDTIASIDGSEKRKALDNKERIHQAEMRKLAREQGLEYKSQSKIMGTGNAKDPMLYKIRKYILFHLIDNPSLAKRGAFKKMWDEKYTHILPYDKNMTNTAFWPSDKQEIITKLKDADLYKRISYTSVGNIITLIQTQHEAQVLRKENAELRDMLQMYRTGDNIVINQVVYRGDDNYYYLPDITGTEQRVRKGAFNNAFNTAIKYGLIKEEANKCLSKKNCTLDSLAKYAQ